MRIHNIIRISFWLVLMQCVLISAMAQDTNLEKKGVNDKKCPFCKTTGRIANPFYARYVKSLNLEKIRFSSWVIENDPKGYGLPWYPCERCRNDDLKARAEVEFNNLVTKRLKWLEKRRKIDAELEAKEPLLHLDTEHYHWVWNIPNLTYKKKKYRSHEALHLYAMRLEQFYRDFQKEHKITDHDLSGTRHHFYVFERMPIAMRACPKYGKQASPSGRVFLHGNPSVSVMYWDKTIMPDEESLFRFIIHNATHMLVAVYQTPWWLFESGFVYEGLAHWWELYYYDKATATCMREIDILRHWVASKWEQKVKKAVLAAKCPSLVSLLGKNAGALTAREHIFSWSVVDYMMYLDSRKLLDFCLALKKNKPEREAFYEIWGTSILNFDAQWKEFVKKHYKLLKPSTVVSTRRTRAKMRGPIVEKVEDDDEDK